MLRNESPEYLAGLVRELCKLPHEVEWVEFKGNDAEPQTIGEYISALSNAAAVNGKVSAYLLWGVNNQSHDIEDTTFRPNTARRGNQPLESWLLQLLEPKIHFRFHDIAIEGKQVVLLEIERAVRHPVRFAGTEYIRIGEVKKKLKDAPDRERELWRVFDQIPFEDLVAEEQVSSDAVLTALDYPAYFDLLEAPLPANRDGILAALAEDDLIRRSRAGDWDITNLGAILFAKQLASFPRLKRKAVRVIQYRGADRTETLKEQVGGKGYAAGFEGLLGYINGLIPSNEVIGPALRKTVPMFPELAVRELVANALIHQDFLIRGTGPMVEIFADRMEITNPGEPLVNPQRFIDTPPKSRNETLASLMRRFRICEERGSGIDKVVFQVELFQLPAPLFEVPQGFTRTVLFAHKPFKDMEKRERIRASYLHACLCYVTRQRMTNTTLRERFGVDARNAATISRVLNEAVEAGAITIEDESVGTRSRCYLPFWATIPSGSGGGV